MLKNSLMFLVIILLTACQHTPGWHKTLPAINFSPVKTVEMPGKVTGEYSVRVVGNDSNLLIVFYVQIMPDDFVMQLHRF
ncbi:Lysis protein for colicin [Klebsiella quasipneumoniae subsp. similipneumoniae]